MTDQLGTFLAIVGVCAVFFVVKKLRGPQAPHEPRYGGGQPPLPPEEKPEEK